MSITTGWVDAEKTIACYGIVGTWTWDEFQAAIGEVDDMLKTVSHRVDVIIDFTGSPGEPPRSVLSHLRGGPLNTGSNWGGAVFVGLSPFMQVILNTFMRVEPELSSRYAVAHTVQDARIVIDHWRAAQPEGKSPGSSSIV